MLYPIAGWPGNLLTIYLETFAFVAAFRPRLHRPWAAGLIAFHLVSGLVMHIGFYHHILLLGVLGLASPFAPQRTSPRDLLRDLPLFGDVWTWCSRAPRSERLARGTT